MKIEIKLERPLRGDVKKAVVFGGGGRGGMGGGSKITTVFADAEAFQTCKNIMKLLNLCALPCLGLGLCLTLTVFFDLA